MNASFSNDKEVMRRELALDGLAVLFCEMLLRSWSWVLFALDCFSRGLGRESFLAGHPGREGDLEFRCHKESAMGGCAQLRAPAMHCFDQTKDSRQVSDPY